MRPLIIAIGIAMLTNLVVADNAGVVEIVDDAVDLSVPGFFDFGCAAVRYAPTPASNILSVDFFDDADGVHALFRLESLSLVPGLGIYGGAHGSVNGRSLVFYLQRQGSTQVAEVGWDHYYQPAISRVDPSQNSIEIYASWETLSEIRNGDRLERPLAVMTDFGINRPFCWGSQLPSGDWAPNTRTTVDDAGVHEEFRYGESFLFTAGPR